MSNEGQDNATSTINNNSSGKVNTHQHHNKKKIINLMNSDTLFSYPIALLVCAGLLNLVSKFAKEKAARLYSSKKNINHLIMYLSTVKRDVANIIMN